MFDQYFLKHPIAAFNRKRDGSGAPAGLKTDPSHISEPFKSLVSALPEPSSPQLARAEVQALLVYERTPPAATAEE